MTTSQHLLSGKTALITGGGGGIGAGMAQGLAQAGARLILADIDERGLEKTADELRLAGANVTTCLCDVTQADELSRLFDLVKTESGVAHILVNNYGEARRRRLFIDTQEEDWRDDIERNLIHVLRCTQWGARQMIENGVAGSIVNVTTIEGFRAAPAYSVYAAAKAGVTNFTKTLALELAPYGIRVNEIAPDATITEGSRNVSGMVDAEKARFWAHIPRNRRGRPADYAGAAVFLASDMSEWVTGEAIHVDGGTMAASGWRRDEEGRWNNGGQPQAFSGRKLRESEGRNDDR